MRCSRSIEVAQSGCHASTFSASKSSGFTSRTVSISASPASTAFDSGGRSYGKWIFVGDHHEAAVEAFLAQCLHDPTGRLAAADHDDRARRFQSGMGSLQPLQQQRQSFFRSVMNLPSGAFAFFWRRVLPSMPPSIAHSANTVGPGSKSRGCHSGVSWSSSA
jgi:hypothetical protein